ncbi:MAG: DUF3842 family protein [Lachnospiraceae bacterium]|jgi:hypothetical protein|nr:DUF3842 family protein [Lachnospiraceae bacterium]
MGINMNILVIDGMGGGIGKAVIEHLRSEYINANNRGNITITATGTNSLATAAMLKAGANYGATGENAIAYNCSKADFIIGVIGIMMVNSMHGEISPRIVEAVSGSGAHKLLIPIDKCNLTVMGVAERPMQTYIAEISKTLNKIMNDKG